VDHSNLRMSLQDGVSVHLFELRAAILECFPRNDFQTLGERDGFRASVRLEVTDDDVNAETFQIVRLAQHLIGLSHPGGVPQEDFEPAARGLPVRHCGKTRTSIPSASRMRRSSGVPPRRFRQPRRRLWPTKIWVMPWLRA